MRNFFTGLVAVILLNSCSTVSYYHQAASGQVEIWKKSELVEEVLKAPTTDPDLAWKLRLVDRILQFSEKEMRLDSGGSYRSYADLGRPYVVWNVYAAPAFSTRGKTWWYPLVGSLEYRGYFDEEKATTCALNLREQGWDVYVSGVEAYSTLGWFRDPLLNTFMDRDEEDLVALICHELAHVRFFKASDAPFSEAFAVAVEEEALRRWGIKETGPRSDERIRFFLEAQDELESFYQESVNQSVAHRRSEKSRRLQEIENRYRARFGAPKKGSLVDRWFTEGLNNAHFVPLSTYHEQLPLFRELLRQSNGDLSAFYEAVEEEASQR